jgi:hypothetical protein
MTEYEKLYLVMEDILCLSADRREKGMAPATLEDFARELIRRGVRVLPGIPAMEYSA